MTLLSCLHSNRHFLSNFFRFLDTLSETQKREILDIHNKYRNNLGWKDRTGTRFSGQAQNMRVLNWDSRLEETAEEVAGLCRRTHIGLYGPRVGLLENEIGPIGENLYFADPEPADATGWTNERCATSKCRCSAAHRATRRCFDQKAEEHFLQFLRVRFRACGISEPGSWKAMISNKNCKSQEISFVLNFSLQPYARVDLERM